MTRSRRKRARRLRQDTPTSPRVRPRSQPEGRDHIARSLLCLILAHEAVDLRVGLELVEQDRVAGKLHEHAAAKARHEGASSTAVATALPEEGRLAREEEAILMALPNGG